MWDLLVHFFLQYKIEIRLLHGPCCPPATPKRFEASNIHMEVEAPMLNVVAACNHFKNISKYGLESMVGMTMLFI